MSQWKQRSQSDWKAVTKIENCSSPVASIQYDRAWTWEMDKTSQDPYNVACFFHCSMKVLCTFEEIMNSFLLNGGLLYHFLHRPVFASHSLLLVVDEFEVFALGLLRSQSEAVIQRHIFWVITVNQCLLTDRRKLTILVSWQCIVVNPLMR